MSHTTHSARAASEGRPMNSDEQRADRAERLQRLTREPMTVRELVLLLRDGDQGAPVYVNGCPLVNVVQFATWASGEKDVRVDLTSDFNPVVSS